MDIDEVESFLNEFNERVGRIRGNSLGERLETLRTRYKKTAEDSEKEAEAGNDTSIYRSSYGATHDSVADEIADYIHLDKLDKIESLICFLTEEVRAEFSNRTPASDGRLDAYGFIIAELRKAAEV